MEWFKKSASAPAQSEDETGKGASAIALRK